MNGLRGGTFQRGLNSLRAVPTAIKAVIVHLDIVILSIILLVLGVAILILCGNLLLRTRRAVSLPTNEINDRLKNVPQAPETALTPLRVYEHTTEEKPTDFVFRRNLIQDHPPAPPADAPPPSVPPAKIAFSTIQDEIRAALGQAANGSTTSSAVAPSPVAAPVLPALAWTEEGRLAVLSLGDATAETAWSLLQAHGVHILIVPQDHPFPAASRMIELIYLSSYNDASMPELIGRLRAKLAKGERIAFYTETGLSGTGAFLAARLSGRNTA